MNWCWPTLPMFGGCENWTCVCGHNRSEHYNFKERQSCARCLTCLNFIYLHNNNCNVECLFKRKIYEIENN